MGTDISGCIEVRVPDWSRLTPTASPYHWVSAIGLDLVYLSRDYDLFGCLFGVRNFAGFDPVAPDRGVPHDASEEVAAVFTGDGETDHHGATWLTWAEAAQIDWTERAVRTDERIHQYRRAEDGTLRLVEKSFWSRRLEALIGAGRRPGDPAHEWPEGTEWADGDTVFRVERLRRADAVPADGEWQPVWGVMEALAAVHGPEGVRLVVWFDS